MTLGHLQIDSPLRLTRFPVLLAAVKPRGKAQGAGHAGRRFSGLRHAAPARPPPCFRLSAQQLMCSNDVIYLQRLFVELQPLCVALEQARRRRDRHHPSPPPPLSPHASRQLWRRDPKPLPRVPSPHNPETLTTPRHATAALVGRTWRRG